MGPSGAWIIEDNMKLQKYIAWTGVFAHDTVAFGHGKLAYLKHELQRIPFAPVNVFAAYDTVAHGHGPSKACIFLWAWGAYIFEASTSTYIV